jgi:hypothetical protein
MDAPANLADAGDVLSIGRRYRTALDRLDTLDERWIGLTDDAPGKWDAAAAAQAALHDAERLLLSSFHRRLRRLEISPSWLRMLSCCSSFDARS